MSSRFLDPEGRRFGVPTWPWRLAPTHLRTWRQLDAAGRRPTGEWEAQIRGTGWRRAYLYDVQQTRPKREPSAAQLESLRIARWVRSVQACERRGIDAGEMRELIEQARTDLAARRAEREGPRRERSR
ncbi:hypothetical protein IU500_34385 [Nocardia terpenica]|uniref:hypothetical protein n=1 Tax=Nocardia terpenica TaxID=455432 RepID=UPI0018962DF7|nr:hypothetical protein [Nocardia terpenica]MBF6065423.1 hypothetical protein [Nocardia terpenica]MBF6109105.1 hypothetical protein [Nocardia terpenica]MBF6114693.1 hypothetical protein [Nocardia terpenica]MBF6123378.1 hypothetical protein [Nocardia terpenica]MBF6156604.1 hypothetical protein [Nocardia terpenica]